jgi:hypothetical protein
MKGQSGACLVCGEVPRADEPVIPEEFYPGSWWHLSCLNSPTGLEWRERRRQSDPRYARYLRLSTVGLPIECPRCGQACCISAKARGMGAGSWEACCTGCSRVTFLSGYAHEAEYDAVAAAEHTFLFDEANDDWRARMQELATRADRLLRDQTCRCGGRFSLAAPPRCPRCAAVLLDSFFHHGYMPSPGPETT